MRNLLVPVDFTKCSLDALDTAHKIAGRLDQKIILVHVVNHKSGKEIPPAFLENARKELRNLKEKYPEVVTDTYLAVGRFVQELRRLAGIIRPWAVVMGSHGISGKSEFFIGSNAQKVVRLLPFPVFVIREPLQTLSFDKVVFASGFNENELNSFRYFLEMVRPFNAEIHLVYIQSDIFFTPPVSLLRQAMGSFRKESGTNPCICHIYKDLTIEAGIRNISEEIGADLIGISNHQRNPLKRMLTGSKVEALVNHSRLPVLSINFEN